MSNKLSDRIRGVNLLSIPQSPSRAGFVQTTIEDTSGWPLVGFNRIKDGWIVADGSELSIAAYGELYAVIGDRYATSDYIDNNGDVQTYAAPAAGNFRVPDLRNIYLRGDGQFALGDVLNDQIQNITGSTLNNIVSGSQYSSGAITTTTSVGGAAGRGEPINDWKEGTISFDASLVVRAGEETRPKTAVVSYIIKMYGDSGSVSISTDNLVAKDVEVSGDLTVQGDYIGLPEASDTEAGIVTTGTQDFSGTKNFGDDVNVDGSIGVRPALGSSSGPVVVLESSANLYNGGSNTNTYDFPDMLEAGSVNSQFRSYLVTVSTYGTSNDGGVISEIVIVWGSSTSNIQTTNLAFKSVGVSPALVLSRVDVGGGLPHKLQVTGNNNARIQTVSIIKLA